jgi:hypothetical protein
MSNKEFETTPNSLYFLAGSLSAVVFFYTINTIFIMSATGSVSFLIMKLSSISNSNGLMALKSIGLLLLVISSIFLGSYIVQYIYLSKLKSVLKNIFYIFIITTILVFVFIYLFNQDLNFINILKGKQLNANIYLALFLSTSSFIIGMVWMLMDGTTAMSNAVKELILRSSGARNKNYKSFLGLIGFVITGIAYYGIYEYQDTKYTNDKILLFLLCVNMLFVLILIFDSFCVNNNSIKLLKNLEKNCDTIPKTEYIPRYIRNVSIFLIVYFIGLIITIETPFAFERNTDSNHTSKIIPNSHMNSHIKRP